MVWWTWWDWSLSLGLLLPSVLWHCRLGHLTRKNPSPIWSIMCLVGVKPYSINQSIIRPHRGCRWTVQSYFLGGANVPSYLGTLTPPVEYGWTSASFSPLESITQTANRSVQPFLHSSLQKVSILYNSWLFPPNCPFPWGIWTTI